VVEQKASHVGEVAAVEEVGCDTGIPLSYFDRAKWQSQPFGHYVHPIAVFSHNYQPKLAELFRNGNPIPIDFGLGYRWRLNQSNLLLAQKKGSEPKAN
jgi:hypothetical protein